MITFENVNKWYGKYQALVDVNETIAQGEVVVAEVYVAVGNTLDRDDKVIALETGKVALDIPSPHKGTVVEVLVKPGDRLEAGQILCILDTRA